jgi:large subunit ribosomal protein L13
MSRPIKLNKNNTTRASITGKHRKWVIFDASTMPVGRLATEIARSLMGKYQVDWMNDVDCGDCVVVINTDKLVFTGRKVEQKSYHRHSLYMGGLTSTLVKQQLVKDSTFIIKNAVSKMLPKNTHRADRLARLHIYKDFRHPYQDKIKSETKQED